MPSKNKKQLRLKKVNIGKDLGTPMVVHQMVVKDDLVFTAARVTLLG